MSDPETKTILVVDDEPDVLVLVELFLEGEGYHVETAGHGHQERQRKGRDTRQARDGHQQ